MVLLIFSLSMDARLSLLFLVGALLLSNTSRMILAICRITIGFITKDLIPISLALFSPICSLKPVQRMMGMSEVNDLANYSRWEVILG